jgi:excisionase family DNA binding protein
MGGPVICNINRGPTEQKHVNNFLEILFPQAAVRDPQQPEMSRTDLADRMEPQKQVVKEQPGHKQHSVRRKRTKFMANEIQNTQQAANGSQPEGYITKVEVAKRLKKTVRTVENWQRRGILPFIKAGRSVLFKWSDCEMHLHQNFRVCKAVVTK